MQVPSIPPPIVTNALAQDVVAKVALIAQAAQPLLQNAVTPGQKSDKSTESRSNKDKGRGGKEDNARDEDANDGEKPDHSVNISV